MTLFISRRLLDQIHALGEAAYPEEGAGLLYGEVRRDDRLVRRARPLPNSFEADGRRRRYRIDPRELIAAESEAEAQGVEVIGVFHSHPDHPAAASETDREWALPWLSYLITSVQAGRASETRSWRLADDRSEMTEEAVLVAQEV